MAANRSRFDDPGSIRGHGPLLRRGSGICRSGPWPRTEAGSMIQDRFAGTARSYGEVPAFVGAAHGRE